MARGTNDLAGIGRDGYTPAMADPIDHPARFASVPAPGAFAPAQVVRELGDGLVLRRASPTDTDAIDGFNRFLELVAPALEERLAASDQAGRSGPLELGFYGDGLRLVFECGRLRGVEHWQPTTEQRGHVAFPGLTFLQLLLGFRSLRELQRAFPDCHASSEAHAPWVEALFPPAPSDLIPVS